MNIVRTKSTALAVAAAALAAPALLAAAGTAHAAPRPSYSSNGHLRIRYEDAPESDGLKAWIQDDLNPVGVTEVCHYASTGQGLNALLPFNADVVLNGTDAHPLFIPGHPHNAMWNVTVQCDGTGQTLNFSVFY